MTQAASGSKRLLEKKLFQIRLGQGAQQWTLTAETLLWTSEALAHGIVKLRFVLNKGLGL